MELPVRPLAGRRVSPSGMKRGGTLKTFKRHPFESFEGRRSGSLAEVRLGHGGRVDVIDFLRPS